MDGPLEMWHLIFICLLMPQPSCPLKLPILEFFNAPTSEKSSKLVSITFNISLQVKSVDFELVLGSDRSPKSSAPSRFSRKTSNLTLFLRGAAFEFEFKEMWGGRIWNLKFCMKTNWTNPKKVSTCFCFHIRPLHGENAIWKVFLQFFPSFTK